MKRLWSASTVLALVLIGMIVMAAPAAGQDEIEELVLDATTCRTLGGAWDTGTDSCVLERGGEIAEGQVLTIPEDVILWVFASMTLNNNGTINNAGQIDNDGIVNNYNTIINQGDFNNRKGVVVLGILYNYATFANRGTFHNDGLIENRGIFTSDVRIEGDGTITGTINYLTVEELCLNLDGFISQVNVVTGDLITSEQADQLLETLTQSKDVLSCP